MEDINKKNEVTSADIQSGLNQLTNSVIRDLGIVNLAYQIKFFATQHNLSELVLLDLLKEQMINIENVLNNLHGCSKK